MRYLDEYREAAAVRSYARRLARLTTRPWTLMEVCGGQTHAVVRFGLDRLLPPGLRLIHGPGCPVCVTPLEKIDKALRLASRPGVILASFGDMLRVPGSRSDLGRVRARGGEVQVVYSPLDALKLARDNPGKQVVFFAVGFETTAPANAMAVYLAKRERRDNFSVLLSQVRVPPILERLLASSQNGVQGFLAAGHVCTVMGVSEYEALVRRHRVPVVVTGFEPVDILQGIAECVAQLESGRAELQNPYARWVKARGNQAAREMLDEVFEICDCRWRGLGEVAHGGFALAAAYAAYDAEKKFDDLEVEAQEPELCISGLVLQGLRRPPQCPAFGGACTPQTPLGAPMVSGEGACAAYYRYRSLP